MTEAAAVSNVTPISLEVKAVQTFQTPDGKFFATEADARQHLAREKFSAQAEAYVSSRDDWAKGIATKTKNIICDYLAWAEAQK